MKSLDFSNDLRFQKTEYAVGTIRDWQGEKHQKQSDGSWKPVSESKDREKKDEESGAKKKKEKESVSKEEFDAKVDELTNQWISEEIKKEGGMVDSSFYLDKDEKEKYYKDGKITDEGVKVALERMKTKDAGDYKYARDGIKSKLKRKVNITEEKKESHPDDTAEAKKQEYKEKGPSDSDMKPKESDKEKTTKNSNVTKQIFSNNELIHSWMTGFAPEIGHGGLTTKDAVDMCIDELDNDDLLPESILKLKEKSSEKEWNTTKKQIRPMLKQAFLDFREKAKKSVKKSLKANIFSKIKNKFQKAGYAVGTIRDWKGEKHQKQSDGSWKPVSEGKERGKKDGESKPKKENYTKKEFDAKVTDLTDQWITKEMKKKDGMIDPVFSFDADEEEKYYKEGKITDEGVKVALERMKTDDERGYESIRDDVEAKLKKKVNITEGGSGEDKTIHKPQVKQDPSGKFSVKVGDKYLDKKGNPTSKENAGLFDKEQAERLATHKDEAKYVDMAEDKKEDSDFIYTPVSKEARIRKYKDYMTKVVEYQQNNVDNLSPSSSRYTTNKEKLKEMESKLDIMERQFGLTDREISTVANEVTSQK